MTEHDVKKTLRELKKLELVVRYGISYSFIQKNQNIDTNNAFPLVWNSFFYLGGRTCSCNANARYRISELINMTRDEVKNVIDEYWFNVYYQIYCRSGKQMFDMPSPELLSYLELPMTATDDMVKKRFRELCKRYHPDQGGSEEKFIELMHMMEEHQQN